MHRRMLTTQPRSAVFPQAYTRVHCVLTKYPTLSPQIQTTLQAFIMPEWSVILSSEQKFTFPTKLPRHVRILACTSHLACLGGLSGNSGTRLKSCNGQLDRRRITKAAHSRESQLYVYFCILICNTSKSRIHYSHRTIVPCRSSGCKAILWEDFGALSFLNLSVQWLWAYNSTIYEGSSAEPVPKAGEQRKIPLKLTLLLKSVYSGISSLQKAFQK